jgi:3-deoxy-D-manno-octulosonic acid kinase
LEVSLAARAHAVRTPAILAARVVGWGIYRGVVVSEEVVDTMTLAEALHETGDAARGVHFARAAGEAVARLHGAGVEHADLNLGNILVSRRGPEVPAQIIDLDKARLRGAPLAASARRRNLRRLARSWRRVTAGTAVPADLREGFRTGYETMDGLRCEC